MRITEILLSFFLLTSLNGLSQSTYIGKSDQDAKKILDAVSARFKTYKTVTAKFVLKIENASGQVMGTKVGTVYMKGSKYRVDVAGQEIYSDGTNIWTYDKSANEVQITQFDPTANTITPQKMFTNFYDKDFLYKLNDDFKQGNRMITQIELTPVDKTKPFFKVLINVDKKTQAIVSSEVFQKTGDRYLYSISTMKANTNIPDSLFAFDAKNYPNVEVVDLR
jgi:outer membrane lipoprotein carrier protein